MSNSRRYKKANMLANGDVGKEVKAGAFTVQIMKNGYVRAKAAGGFSITYPSGSMITGHIYQFVIDNNIEALKSLLTLHYSYAMITPDKEFYENALKNIDSFVDRNKKSPLCEEEDEAHLAFVKEGVNAMSDTKDDDKELQ